MADLEIWRFIRTFAPVTSMWQYILVWVVGREIDSPFFIDEGVSQISMFLKKWGCEKRETCNLLIYNDLYKSC
jgi:hypothetical protein